MCCCMVCVWLWGLRWVGWLSSCHLPCSSLSGPAVNQLWKITSHSVGDSWVYSKYLVTSNMLSMNLRRCRCKASTHSAGKPMSTAVFCDCVQGDCSFRSYYNFRNEKGVDVYMSGMCVLFISGRKRRRAEIIVQGSDDQMCVTGINLEIKNPSSNLNSNVTNELVYDTWICKESRNII